MTGVIICAIILLGPFALGAALGPVFEREKENIIEEDIPEDNTPYE